MSNTYQDSNGSRKGLTPSVAERVEQLVRDSQGGLPVWVRAPVEGYERYSSLSRAKLYALAADGKIETKNVRDAGKERGCRLFSLRSILKYIETCPDDGIASDNTREPQEAA